jgi:primosomal protein N' (replication factor Y)
LPTAEEVKNLSSLLPKGIEDYTYAFYNSLTKKKMIDLWEKASSDEHPILVIATAPFFALCREDLGTIIIENESSRSYKLPIRPYLDVRVFAEYFAKECNIRIIFGDTLLRTETIYRVKQGEVAELSPLKFRSLSPALSTVIDMSNYKKTGNGKFETISPELENLIKQSQTKNQNLFIFAGRRGFAPQTVCGDCGTIVLCSRCKSPITLHLAKQDFSEHNFFFCHNCGEQRNAEERCAKCQSWKLLPLGIGIELISDEIKRKIPNIKIFRVDKDSTNTKIKAEKVVEEFYSSPGSILIGTEMVFSYLDKKIGNTAVASLDAMFSLPDFRIHEKILHILIKIRSLAEANFVVQTRIPNEKILDYAVKGNLMDFYREEI